VQLTQAALAKQIAVSPILISYYERGHRTPRYETAQKIANVLRLEGEDREQFLASLKFPVESSPDIHELLDELLRLFSHKSISSKKDPSLIPAATEELLRLYTPYRGFARTPTRDVEIGGRLIREDEPVALSFTSGNRDAAAFEDPDEFRLDRADAPPHLTFGRGPHQCPGAPLARLMLVASLEEFTRSCNGFEANGPTSMTTWPEYGPYSVPVRLR
jgi:cytochrome P450